MHPMTSPTVSSAVDAVTYAGGCCVSEGPSANRPEWTLGDRLRKAREFAKLDQDELGQLIGLSRQSVSNYERDRGHRDRTVALWAKVCGVDLKWIRGE